VLDTPQESAGRKRHTAGPPRIMAGGDPLGLVPRYAATLRPISSSLLEYQTPSVCDGPPNPAQSRPSGGTIVTRRHPNQGQLSGQN